MGALGIPDGVLRRAASIADPLGEDAGELLTGRAALLGLVPRGQVSAGGATRLLPASDGWFALTLARDDDIAAIPALTEAATSGDFWTDIQRWAATRRTAEIVERAGLLGMPAARLGEAAAIGPRVQRCGPRGRATGPLVVAHLTSMWAGPLAGRLLAGTGAAVIKVESPGRPDGTRRGSPEFFDWMNAGKLSYAADFDGERAKIRRVIEAADVVLESSRPTALIRRSLGPQDVAGRPGRVWVRITGHGANPPNAHRVAFGDDAAVAGGLIGNCSGAPEFIGDAIADPLTGLEAAAAVHASLRRGGGELIDIAMAEVAAGYAQCDSVPTAPADPVRPAVAAAAPALGADNARVERPPAQRC